MLLLGLLPPIILGVTVATQAISRTAIPLSLVADESLPLLITGAVVALVALILWAQRTIAPLGAGWQPDWPRSLPALVAWAVIVPLAGIAALEVHAALAASPPMGPVTRSIFVRAGAAASYAGPALVTALVFVGYALRERSGTFALAGGLTLNAAATLAWFLSGIFPASDAAFWIRLAQLNAAVAAAFTLAWAGIAAWDRRREGRYGFAVRGPSFRAERRSRRPSWRLSSAGPGRSS